MLSQAKLRRLPDSPGVYFFLGPILPRRARQSGEQFLQSKNRSRREKRNILYIGRATSLRNRVRSYFASDITEKRSQWIKKMIGEATSVDFKKTDSVLEAILLEADLIKKFKPPYNTELKDDKSFNCVVITKEDFPRLLVARQRGADLAQTSRRQTRKGASGFSAVYGPFPNGLELKHAIKIIRRIFPYRDSNCTPCIRQRSSAFSPRQSAGCKPCFNRQIGLCPGTCTGEITKVEYAKTIRNLRLFFEGRKTRLLKLLKKEMREAAREQAFEKAGELKRQLFALKHIQDIALLNRESASASVPRSHSASVQRTLRIEGYDLSHFGGKEIVGAMTVVESGRAVPSQYRLFKLRGLRGANEPAGMEEIIRRRLNHPEWSFPSLIVVDGGEIQKRAAEMAVASSGFSIPIVAVVKDERHGPREILGAEGVAMHRAAILLAAGEAHRFVLKFQRKKRSFL